MSSESDEPTPELPDVLGDTELQSETLEDLTSAKNYHRWLTSLAVLYLGADPIEIGSGLGDYAETWLTDGTPRITVTDPDAARAATLRARFAGDERVTVARMGLPVDGRSAHSALVAFNVLEHIADDVEALRSARRFVAPGGAVVMLVPAFPFAMSRFDLQVGHVRRYRRKSLVAAFEAAGLRVEKIHYVNSVGLVAWLVMMKLLKQTPKDSAALRIYDATVVRVVRAVERRVRPPFGQSLFVVGRAPGSMTG